MNRVLVIASESLHDEIPIKWVRFSKDNGVTSFVAYDDDENIIANGSVGTSGIIYWKTAKPMPEPLPDIPNEARGDH